ncbi:MAG: hypothetical protein H7331_12035 [Bacteroidia bacterium]|nr:hypothetical protein [Bacteroidia bacterium]
MTLQFIHDVKGNTTGVYIPIDDWQALKTKYSALQTEEVENTTELATWQKEVIDQRLNDYYENTNDVANFDTMLSAIEKKI